MSAWRPALAWVCARVLLLAIASPVVAQGSLEASVKAAYLFKFLGYVDWPASVFTGDDSPLTIGIVGAEAVHAQLDQAVAGRRSNQRAIVVKRVDAIDALEPVHLIYFGPSAAPSYGALRALQRRHVLVVTDSPGGLSSGAVLNFVLVDGRVRFEVSLVAAEQAGLKVSSRLLVVAERVIAP